MMMRLLLGRSPRIGHHWRGSVCVVGLRCWDVCKLWIPIRTLRVMKSWLLGTASPASLMRVRRGFFLLAVSFVIGWPWVQRFIQSHSCASSLVRLPRGYVKGEGASWRLSIGSREHFGF